MTAGGLSTISPIGWIIKAYAAHLDQVAVGVPIDAFVSATLIRHAKAELQAFEAVVAASAEVMECLLMTGTSD